MTAPSSNKSNDTPLPDSLSKKWTKALLSVTKPMLKPFLAMSHTAARYPKLTILATIAFSIGIMVLGLATNFSEDTSDTIWTPKGSRPVSHGKWLDEDSNFPTDFRAAMVIVHRDGKSLFQDSGNSDLARESTARLFEALDELRATPRYEELCAMTDYVHPITKEDTCQIVAATSFWNSDSSTFQLEGTTSEAVLIAMSNDTYPNGGQVDFDQIIGFNSLGENGILQDGQSFVASVMFPPDKEDDEDNFPAAFTIDFEEIALERMQKLRDTWDAEANNDYRVEIFMARSFEDEFARAVTSDLPLLPLVFVLMSFLCIGLFTRRDKVLSRSWMGFGAVATVLLAIVASFGLLFVIGVPFTSLTPLLPFIMFGVGLDDAFIISGAYARTDSRKTPAERIDETMEDIGGTILLTTLTSGLAFALGAVSSIPAVRYLVIYAFPTIAIDYLFQITFFVAVIVLDQRRIEANRRDCCFCCSGPDQQVDADCDTVEVPSAKQDEAHYADKIMERYAGFLLQPTVKYSVIGVFLVLLAFCSWRTSELTQYFDFTTVIPSDSYIQTWWDSFQDHYEANGVRAGVYFRDVNFADQEIRAQMDAYVSELADMPYAGENEPFSFWLRDFEEFIQQPNPDGSTGSMNELDFNEQIRLFLEDPVQYDAHHENIVLDENGVMTASRTFIRLDNVDDLDVLEVVDALELQRSITASLPINQGKDDWAFFTFAEDFYIWEFYRVSPDELRLTTIIGVISVSFLALIFIPHWSAIFFVGPMVAVLYIDLLGFIELCGVHVNPVMYISTVMSIGLMVDFVMHVTVRYIETKNEKSRTAKTVDTLTTIGASVLIGGFSTLVGVLPLALSTSEIFWTTFIIFFGLVFLGLLHGLVLLPVLLSMCGPLESVTIVLAGSNINSDGSDEGSSSDLSTTQRTGP